MQIHKLTTIALVATQGTSAAHIRGRSHRSIARGQQVIDGYLPTQSDNALCLGASDNALRNNQVVVLQPCGANSTAKWHFDGSALKTGNGMCLDVPDGNDVDGQTLQLYRCYSGNTNQAWERVGDNTLQWRGHNKCVDVMNGCFSEETPLQVWECFSGNTHQAFDFSALEATAAPATLLSSEVYTNPRATSFTSISTATSTPRTTSTTATPATAFSSPAATSTVSADGGSFHGYSVISLSAFVARYPDCAQWQGALEAAGDSVGISPTFLGAIAMIESSCGAGLAGSQNAQYGPFQFMDDSAWNTYSGAGKDRTNFWDAAYGAANYFKVLIDNEDGNLYQAMRDYNGPVSSGGAPDYQDMAAGYMAGTR